MIFRSFLVCTFVAGTMVSGGAGAQVLLCPGAPSISGNAADMPAEAERLLRRLTTALDLHGHRGIDEKAIIRAHTETPSALLAKLGNVADRCASKSGDLETFYAALPELRRAFLAATDQLDTDQVDNVEESTEEARIEKASLDWSEAERVEQSIDLSVRELWRKLWFRPAKGDDDDGDRWAVIVASPHDADSGWNQLGEHQRHWKDAYFQLHEPFNDENPHHAIVVGRRLPQDQAMRLRDYVVELGMAEDAYVWSLPGKDEAAIDRADTTAATEGGSRYSPEDKLDLSVLDQ